MSLLHFTQHWLMHSLDEEDQEDLLDQIPYGFFESEGFLLGQAMILSVCALISVANAIGDLSRFL